MFLKLTGAIATIGVALSIPALVIAANGKMEALVSAITLINRALAG